jgi:ABC-2 type transport system ATP-binding protein
MNDLVLITNLSYRRNWQTLLEHLELHIQANRIVGLLGANGAGKTTLIRLIAGLSVAYRGTIEVEQVTSPLARKSIVSTNLAMIGSAKGATVTALASFWQGVYPDFDHNVFNQLATQLNLPLNTKLEALSKGNRAKVELALCLSRRARLYLLDEPFNGIDSMTRKTLVNEILNWLPENASIILSDHHVTDIAPLLDEVVIIKDKRVVVQADADEIREQHQSLETYYESFYQKEIAR